MVLVFSKESAHKRRQSRRVLYMGGGGSGEDGRMMMNLTMNKTMSLGIL